jgi:hypothetical protein
MNGVLPATEALMERFYERQADLRPRMTVRGVVALKDGEPHGLGGGYLDAENGRAVFFADMTDELRSDKRLLLRFTKAALEAARGFGVVVHSLADPSVEGSQRLLEHLGGRPVGERIYEFEVL